MSSKSTLVSAWSLVTYAMSCGRRLPLKPTRKAGRPVRQHPDQLIELAIVVRNQGCECPIGQGRRVGLGLYGNIADVSTALAENAGHGSIAVIAPLEDRRSQRHKPPEQIEGFRRIQLGDR